MVSESRQKREEFQALSVGALTLQGEGTSKAKWEWWRVLSQKPDKENQQFTLTYCHREKMRKEKLSFLLSFKISG